MVQRDNFQMDGPVRVMKQLEAMPKILEVTDADMLKHLVLVGADNFLFAFRMLLVLFRQSSRLPKASTCGRFESSSLSMISTTLVCAHETGNQHGYHFNTKPRAVDVLIALISHVSKPLETLL